MKTLGIDRPGVHTGVIKTVRNELTFSRRNYSPRNPVVELIYFTVEYALALIALGDQKGERYDR